MCYFPNINYVNELLPLGIQFDNLPPSVLGQITIIQGVGLLPNLDGINNMIELEERINILIRGVPHNLPENGLLEIFHLIQIWGGRSGRNIYVMGNGEIGTPERFNNNFNTKAYQKLVSVCIDENSTDNKLNEAACDFNKATNQINVSFITKHIKFWNSRNRGLEAVPIYDNIMAKNVMLRQQASINDLMDYWNCMRLKSNELGVSVSALERSLFIHFATI